MVTKRILWAAVAAFLLAPSAVWAQTSPTQHGVFDTSSAGNAESPQGSASAPYFQKVQGYTTAVAITPGTPFAASSEIAYVCTTAGTITVTLTGGSTMTFPIAVGAYLQTLPLSATNIALGTAAGTFWAVQ